MLYDSGYAANMVAGRWQPNTNTNVVQGARGLLAEVEKSRTVHWVHVKGHSGDGGNDRADELLQWGKEEGPYDHIGLYTSLLCLLFHLSVAETIKL